MTIEAPTDETFASDTVVGVERNIVDYIKGLVPEINGIGYYDFSKYTIYNSDNNNNVNAGDVIKEYPHGSLFMVNSEQTPIDLETDGAYKITMSGIGVVSGEREIFDVPFYTLFGSFNISGLLYKDGVYKPLVGTAGSCTINPSSGIDIYVYGYNDSFSTTYLGSAIISGNRTVGNMDITTSFAIIPYVQDS